MKNGQKKLIKLIVLKKLKKLKVNFLNMQKKLEKQNTPIILVSQDFMKL